MSHKHIRLIGQFYPNLELPAHVRTLRAEAYSWAHLTAAVVFRSARCEAVEFLPRSILHHPQGYLLDGYKEARALSLIIPKHLCNSLLNVSVGACTVSAKWRRLLRRIPESDC